MNKNIKAVFRRAGRLVKVVIRRCYPLLDSGLFPSQFWDFFLLMANLMSLILFPVDLIIFKARGTTLQLHSLDAEASV